MSTKQITSIAVSTDEAPSRSRFSLPQTIRQHGKVLRRLTLPVVLGVIWCALTYGGVVAPIYLPSPTDLWHSFESMSSLLPAATFASAGMTLTGFVIGTTIGTLIGLAMAYSPVVRDIFGDVLDATRPVPVFALIPLLVLWFGIGRLPQIVLIALGTMVILGVTTLEAVRNVGPVHVRAALTLGANRNRIYRTVVIPSILPHLLGAIRVAAAASWGLDVAAEFMGAQTGLGYIMIQRQQYLDTAGIVVVILIYSILAFILDVLIRYAQRPLTRWTERESAGVAGRILGHA